VITPIRVAGFRLKQKKNPTEERAALYMVLVVFCVTGRLGKLRPALSLP
jgi:hypothetical protein